MESGLQCPQEEGPCLEASLQDEPKGVQDHKVKDQEVPLVVPDQPWPKAEEAHLTKCWGPFQTQAAHRGLRQGVPREAKAWWSRQTLVAASPDPSVGER